MPSEFLRTLLVGVAVALLGASIVSFAQPDAHGPFWQADCVLQYLPSYADIDRAICQGEFPLLSPCSWHGGNFLGEYQYGIFSAVHLVVLFIAFRLKLSLAATAAVIGLTYLGITAAGAFRLGRSYNLSTPLAVVMSLAATMNGYTFTWGVRAWIPALASFAWLPWAWWALLIAFRQERGAIRFIPAGIFIYLLLASGWPFTVLMMLVVSVWLCLTNGAKCCWTVAMAWLLGGSLAAPALVGLVEYYPYTSRMGSPFLDTHGMSVPFVAFLGTIFPSFVTRWVWWYATILRPCYEMYGGLTPAVGLLVGLFKYRAALVRQFRWELALLVLAALLSHCGAVGSFRNPFRWLPLFHLLLGLLGALAIQQWQTKARESKRGFNSDRSLGLWAMLLIILLWAWETLAATDAPRIHWVGGTLLALALLWMISEVQFTRSPHVLAWGTVGVTIFAILLPYQGDESCENCFREVSREQSPFETDRTYLTLELPVNKYWPRKRGRSQLGRVANTPMHAGLRFVNGYSALYPRGYLEVCGITPTGTILNDDYVNRTVNVYALPGGLLSRMGVDGLVFNEFQAPSVVKRLEDRGWEITEYNDGAIFCRKGRSPRVWSSAEIESVGSDREMIDRLCNATGRSPNLLVGAETDWAKADISKVVESRLSVRCKVSNPSCSHSIVACARPFYPGYRAFLDGKELPVRVINGLQIAVVVPPGAEGHLSLIFMSKMLTAGIGVSLLGIVAVVLVLTIEVARVSVHHRHCRFVDTLFSVSARFLPWHSRRFP